MERGGKLEAFLGGGDWGRGEGGRAAMSEWATERSECPKFVKGFSKNIQGPGNPGRREYYLCTPSVSNLNCSHVQN
jgi:hypothetical protein